MLIAHIALPVPLPRLFDYVIPDALSIAPYSRVKVPFGNRHLIGIVVSITDNTDFDQTKLKTIETVCDHEAIFPSSLQTLLQWASQYYCYPLGEVLSHALPVLLRQGHPTELASLAFWQITERGQSTLKNSKKGTTKQRDVLAELNASSQSAYYLKSLGISERTLSSLQDKNWIEAIAAPLTNSAWQTEFIPQKSPITLNAEQAIALSDLTQTIDIFKPYLLEGVTGSGKTEVYLQLITHVLAQGKQVLVLVPEIGLTPQTLTRFNARIDAPIDMLHSALNNNERLAVWLRARQGQNAVVIGTRSALFTPFQQLGLIIIDEEHDLSYKQQDGFRYHARDVAMMLAKNLNIPILLGSATPSLESLYNVQQGKYHHLTLTKRTSSAPPLKQHILPIISKKLTAGLAQPLLDEMKKHLAQNNQVFLFLNRRGYSPVILCHECGWIAECPRCESYYTYHQQQNRLFCHHCGSQKKMPTQCPTCQSTEIIPIGVGTEQLESTLSSIFPDMPITRIDSDTISRKGSLEHYLDEIHQGGARILIGTQILAKGHHFPDVTLVGILNVDGALFSTNFRATEYFAQLYTQVAGRAGRESKAGEVILQTHYPDNPMLLTLLKDGYHALARRLLSERQDADLPPFSYQALIRAEATQTHDILQFLQQIKTMARSLSTSNSAILGPFPSAMAKRAGKYRWQILIQQTTRSALHQFINTLLPHIYDHPLNKKVRWSLEVDPIDY